MNSRLIEHAKLELKLAGLFNHNSDYDGCLAPAVMDLIEVFARQGHSGGSAHMVLELFDKVARFQPLTSLEGIHKNGWYVDQSEVMGKPEGTVLQCTRDSSIISWDGGKTWQTVDGRVSVDDGKSFFRASQSPRQPIATGC